MTRFRRETKRFKHCAIDSLILAIEMFNRPHNVSRTEAVLILLQHSFEMLLKATIYEKRGTVCEIKGGNTYGFDKCLGIARSDLNILDEDEAITLSILDGLRDCAMHHLIDLTEQALYIHTQATVSLFDKVLNSFFSEHLADYIPSRVLPVSTSPPQDMLTFVDSEFTQIQKLLSPGRRRMAEVRGRLRHLIVMESNLLGDGGQPTDREINYVARRVRRGDNWQIIFPGVASLRLDMQGHGLTVSIRLTRQPEAAPVRIVKEHEPDYEEATLVREVNLLDRYSMNVTQLAENLGITVPRALALVRYLEIQKAKDCYKEFHISKSHNIKRYSLEAQRKLQEAMQNVDMNAVWEQCRPRAKPVQTLGS